MKILLLISFSLMISQELKVERNIDTRNIILNVKTPKINIVALNINYAGQELVNSSFYYYSGLALKIISYTLIRLADD